MKFFMSMIIVSIIYVIWTQLLVNDLYFVWFLLWWLAHIFSSEIYKNK